MFPLPCRIRAALSALPLFAIIPLAANVFLFPAPSAAAGQLGQATSQPGVNRFYSETGFSVGRDPFWSYFQARGGVRTFGFPVSSDFLFQGCQVQFFQRIVMQQCGTQGVGSLNLLDEGLLPYTRINGSTFPAADTALKSTAPKTTDPDYGAQMLDFIQKNAPDTFDGLPVNFGTTFFNTVSASDAGTDDPGILALLNLELWGAPTSAPAYDPSNHNFVYQRFQRGIMHFDTGCGCTQGLLLADYLKAILTGTGVPGDLLAQAGSSALFASATNGKAPAGTVFAGAFTPSNGVAALLPLPTPVPSAALGLPVASGTPATGSPLAPLGTSISPDYGLSEFIWGQPKTTQRDLTLATDAGFHWQKTLFQWKDIEGSCRGCYDWTEADRVVKASNAAGLKIIGRLDFEPAWARADKAHNGPPDNYQDYWNFVSQFVSRYKAGSPNGTVAAIEIWNEVNLEREWGGSPINQQQAADYVRFIGGAYRAAHAADNKIIVITAGLSPTGVRNTHAMDDVEYLKWLFQAGLKGGVNYDVLGAHGNTQAPCVDCAFNSLPAFPDPSFYFRRIEQLRDVQVQAGDANRQIWLLEFGWTADHIHPSYSWFAVTEEQKAANIIKAFQYAKQNWSPWIGVMTLWTLSDPTWNPDREEYWWAIENPDGTPRPAYNAVKAARSNGTLPN